MKIGVAKNTYLYLINKQTRLGSVLLHAYYKNA